MSERANKGRERLTGSGELPMAQNIVSSWTSEATNSASFSSATISATCTNTRFTTPQSPGPVGRGRNGPTAAKYKALLSLRRPSPSKRHRSRISQVSAGDGEEEEEETVGNGVALTRRTRSDKASAASSSKTSPKARCDGDRHGHDVISQSPMVPGGVGSSGRMLPWVSMDTARSARTYGKLQDPPLINSPSPDTPPLKGTAPGSKSEEMRAKVTKKRDSFSMLNVTLGRPADSGPEDDTADTRIRHDLQRTHGRSNIGSKWIETYGFTNDEGLSLPKAAGLIHASDSDEDGDVTTNEEMKKLRQHRLAKKAKSPGKTRVQVKNDSIIKKLAESPWIAAADWEKDRV